MNSHNSHVVSARTLAFVVVATLAVSCDGCGPAGGPDAGPDGPPPVPTFVALNEAMSRNGDTHVDDQGEFDDWVELYNLTDARIDLDGFTLSDGSNEAVPFPTGAFIDAGGFLVVFLDDALDQGSIEEPHFPFKLAGEGDSIRLFDEGELVDVMTLPALEVDESFGRQVDGEGDFVKLADATPGRSNADVGGGEGEGEGESCESTTTIIINEVLAENETFLDAANEPDPWVELFNSGITGSATVSGLSLAAGGTSAPLPNRQIAAGEYLVVFLDETIDDTEDAQAALSIDGTTAAITLRDECGDVLTVDLDLGAPDVSVGFFPDASVDEDPVALDPTPGAANTAAGG